MPIENPDLKLLLDTEIIKNLPESDKQEIINKCISPCNLNRYTETLLYRFLQHKLGEEGLNTLLKQFKLNRGKGNYNFPTLIKEIYKYKPDIGILRFLETEPKESSFFKGRIFSLNDPNYLFSGDYEIKEVEILQPDQNGNALYDFRFVNGDNITLKVNLLTKTVLNVTKTYKPSCDLLKFLLYPQPDQGYVYIGSKNSSHNLIVSGKYHFVPKMRNNKDTITYIYSLISKDYSYEIEVIYTDKLAFFKINGIFTVINGQRKTHLQDFIPSQYQVTQEKCMQIEKIDYKNLSNHIKIKQKIIDEKREKAEKMIAIKKYHDELVDNFSEKNNHCYLDKLLEDLLQNDLNRLSDDAYINNLLASKFEINDKITEIIKLQSELKNNISAKEILKNIILEANYARLINKIQQVPVYRTMELLKQAFTHIDEMRNRELVLFFGNTGAGKSTSTCYYLGVDLEKKPDSWIGAIDVAETEDNKTLKPGDHYPKIGQSIAASETTYVRGFNLIKMPENISPSLMLADFPGRKDTRGKYHDLATSLSIDRTVKVAKGIKAIVLTIPYNAFLLDRGTPILEIFQTLMEQIPDILDPKKSAAAIQSLFLVITKHPNNTDTEDHFSGMIQDHLTEIGNLKFTAAKDEPNNSDFIENIARNERIWQIIKEVKEQNRIDFIDIENTEVRIKMLEKFSNAPGIRKDQFSKAMDSIEVQRNFKDCIQMSIHTWQKLILERYLENLPKEIENTQSLILQLEEDIKNLTVSNTAALSEISELNKILDAKRAILMKLKKGEIGAAQGEIDRLTNDIKNSNNDRIGAIKRENSQAQQTIQEAERKLNNKSQQIAKIEREIAQAKQNIENLRNNIDRLSTGSRTECLWDFPQHRPGDKVAISYYKDGRFESAFHEVRDLTHNDVQSSSSIIAGKYNGQLQHHAYIARDYYIVPENANDRAKFLKERFVETRSGSYRATLEGLSYSLDLGAKAAPGGRQMVYSFRTTWTTGGVIPWIKVSHSMPNITLNNAAIVNEEATNKTLQKKLAELEADLKMSLKDHAELEHGLKAERKKLETLHNELKSLETQKIQEGIQGIISEYEKNIINIQNKIKDKENLRADNEIKITRRNQDLEAARNRLAALLKEKTHFAILLRTQLDIAKLLMSFSELADDDSLGFDAKKQHSELYETCKEFKKYFGENIGKINEACDKDLKKTSSKHNSEATNVPSTTTPLRRPEEGLRPIRAPVVEKPSAVKKPLTPGVGSDSGTQIIAALHPEIKRRQEQQLPTSPAPTSVAERVGLYKAKANSNTNGSNNSFGKQEKSSNYAGYNQHGLFSQSSTLTPATDDFVILLLQQGDILIDTAKSNYPVRIIFTDHKLVQEFANELHKIGMSNLSMKDEPRKPDVNIGKDGKGDKYIISLTAYEYNKIMKDKNAYTDLVNRQQSRLHI